MEGMVIGVMALWRMVKGMVAESRELHCVDGREEQDQECSTREEEDSNEAEMVRMEAAVDTESIRRALAIGRDHMTMVGKRIADVAARRCCIVLFPCYCDRHGHDCCSLCSVGKRAWCSVVVEERSPCRARSEPKSCWSCLAAA